MTRPVRNKLVILVFPLVIAVITQLSNVTVMATCGCKSLIYGFPFPYMAQRSVYPQSLSCHFAACPNESSFSLIHFVFDLLIWGFVTHLVLQLVHRINNR